MGCGILFKRQLNKENGFTLIEIMMGTAILAFFLLIVYSFLGFNIKYQNEYSADADSYTEARIAMQRIVYLLGQYQELKIAPDPHVPSAGIVYAQNNEQQDQLIPLINFQENESNTMSEVSNYKYYYYRPNGSDYGQILNYDGSIIADGVKDFEIISSQQQDYIDIHIEIIPVNEPSAAPLYLSTGLRLDRKHVVDII